MTPEERLLSTEEVAETLQVDEQTVRRWIKSGKLEAFKPGREWRIRPAALVALLETHSSPKAQAPLPFEDEQRRYLPYIRPWFSLMDRFSEEMEGIAVPGSFDAATFLESDKYLAAAMSSMNMALRELKAQGIDPKTGPIGEELRRSMLRQATALRASADVALQALSESELEKVRKRRAERQAELEDLPDFGKEVTG